MPRFHCPIPLASGQTVDLPASAARHVQVLRMQPGMALTLFNGEGGEFEATVLRMGRSDVQVSVGTHHARECEPARAVHLAVGMPANDRMDWLVEKATELGVAIHPNGAKLSPTSPLMAMKVTLLVRNSPCATASSQRFLFMKVWDR